MPWMWFHDCPGSRKSMTLHYLKVRNRNGRFLQRPQKRGRGNQLIQRRSSKIKSIGMQRVKIQRVTQADGYGGWCLELRMNQEFKMGFVEEQCF